MKVLELIIKSAQEQLSMGDWREALDTAQVGLRFDSENGVLHQIAGVAAYHQEEFGAALFHLETASALLPLGIEPQLLLADLYLRFGQTRAARAILTFLAEPDRCPTPLLPELAKSLGRAGEYHAALEVCERLTKLRPTFHPAWFGVAYYMGQLGRNVKELELPLRRAYQLAPKALPYRLNLAAVLADTGQVTEAYQLIAPVTPDDIECACQCRRFARVCALVGDEKRAAGFLNRYCTLSSSAEVTTAFDYPTNDDPVSRDIP